LQDPPKFTQIWIFGLKTNHLATLLGVQKFKHGCIRESTHDTNQIGRHDVTFNSGRGPLQITLDLRIVSRTRRQPEETIFNADQPIG
jgi:hypothetical protein